MITQAAAFIASCRPEQREIVRRLRAMVKLNMPEAHEMVYHAALGYSYSQSAFDRIVYISQASHHITLGFFFGANLPDPNHLLEGMGTRMRHVKIRSMEEAEDPALARLVGAAWKDAEVSIPKRHRGARKAEAHS